MRIISQKMKKSFMETSIFVQRMYLKSTKFNFEVIEMMLFLQVIHNINIGSSNISPISFLPLTHRLSCNAYYVTSNTDLDPIDTAQKIKLSIKDFFSKWDHMSRKLRIWSHLMKKSLMKNFIFIAVWDQWSLYFNALRYVVTIIK